MRELPDEVQILGKLWSVSCVSKSTLGNNHGDCDTERKRIRIRSDEPEDEQWQTYFHELIHAAIYESFAHGPITVDLGVYEEAIVHALDTALYPAIRTSGFGE